VTEGGYGCRALLSQSGFPAEKRLNSALFCRFRLFCDSLMTALPADCRKKWLKAADYPPVLDIVPLFT